MIQVTEAIEGSSLSIYSRHGRWSMYPQVKIVQKGKFLKGL